MDRDRHRDFVVYSRRSAHEVSESYHWHLQIMPRLTNLAGFELGSGIYINTALPEETAAFLSSVQL